jgi:hypothetical protein
MVLVVFPLHRTNEYNTINAATRQCLTLLVGRVPPLPYWPTPNGPSIADPDFRHVAIAGDVLQDAGTPETASLCAGVLAAAQRWLDDLSDAGADGPPTLGQKFTE